HHIYRYLHAAAAGRRPRPGQIPGVPLLDGPGRKADDLDPVVDAALLARANDPERLVVALLGHLEEHDDGRARRVDVGPADVRVLEHGPARVPRGRKRRLVERVARCGRGQRVHERLRVLRDLVREELGEAPQRRAERGRRRGRHGRERAPEGQRRRGRRVPLGQRVGHGRGRLELLRLARLGRRGRALARLLALVARRGRLLALGAPLAHALARRPHEVPARGLADPVAPQACRREEPVGGRRRRRVRGAGGRRRDVVRVHVPFRLVDPRRHVPAILSSQGRLLINNP
ncbi:unnamed protein product, partial [Pelagomonas calceolata]